MEENPTRPDHRGFELPVRRLLIVQSSKGPLAHEIKLMNPCGTDSSEKTANGVAFELTLDISPPTSQSAHWPIHKVAVSGISLPMHRKRGSPARPLLSLPLLNNRSYKVGSTSEDIPRYTNNYQFVVTEKWRQPRGKLDALRAVIQISGPTKPPSDL